jgi:hypothetical protein
VLRRQQAGKVLAAMMQRDADARLQLVASGALKTALGLMQSQEVGPLQAAAAAALVRQAALCNCTWHSIHAALLACWIRRLHVLHMRPTRCSQLKCMLRRANTMHSCRHRSCFNSAWHR